MQGIFSLPRHCGVSQKNRSFDDIESSGGTQGVDELSHNAVLFAQS